MSIEPTDDIDALAQESSKSIGRLRDLVVDLKYVTELESRILNLEEHAPPGNKSST